MSETQETPINSDTSEARTDVKPINWSGLENSRFSNKNESAPKQNSEEIDLKDLSFDSSFTVKRDSTGEVQAFYTNFNEQNTSLDTFVSTIKENGDLNPGLNTFREYPKYIIYARKTGQSLLDEMEQYERGKEIPPDLIFESVDPVLQRNYALRFEDAETGIQARKKFNDLRKERIKGLNITETTSNGEKMAGKEEENKQDLDKAVGNILNVIRSKGKNREKMAEYLPEGYRVRFKRVGKSAEGYLEIYNNEVAKNGGGLVRIKTEIVKNSGELAAVPSIEVDTKSVEVVFNAETNKERSKEIPKTQWRYVSSLLRPEKEVEDVESDQESISSDNVELTENNENKNENKSVLDEFEKEVDKYFQDKEREEEIEEWYEGYFGKDLSAKPEEGLSFKEEQRHHTETLKREVDESSKRNEGLMENIDKLRNNNLELAANNLLLQAKLKLERRKSEESKQYGLLITTLEEEIKGSKTDEDWKKLMKDLRFLNEDMLETARTPN